MLTPVATPTDSALQLRKQLQIAVHALSRAAEAAVGLDEERAADFGAALDRLLVAARIQYERAGGAPPSRPGATR